MTQTTDKSAAERLAEKIAEAQLEATDGYATVQIATILPLILDHDRERDEQGQRDLDAATRMGYDRGLREREQEVARLTKHKEGYRDAADGILARLAESTK